MNSKQIIKLFLLATAVFVSGAETDEKRQSIVWPDPPNPARIQYIESISSSYDLGATRSTFRKIIDFIIGRDPLGSRLIKPIDVTTDAQGRIYVADVGARCVHIFDQANRKYHNIQRAGVEYFGSPVGIAISKDGSIYVSDSKLRKVLVFDKDRKYKYSIENNFQRPTGLAIKDDRLYIVDTAQHTIYVFDLDGVYITQFGANGTGPGELNFPVFIDVEDDIYLTDAMNFRVQIFDNEHKSKSILGEMGDVQGTFSRPKGIAVDSDDHIYVVDGLFNAFQIFSKEGDLLLVVGSPGTGAGQFSMPTGMYIDSNDRIYIADTMNRRIQIFQYLKVVE